MQKQKVFLEVNIGKLILVVFTSFLLSSIFGNSVIFAASYSLTLTSSGSQEINVTANAGTAIIADTI